MHANWIVPHNQWRDGSGHKMDHVLTEMEHAILRAVGSTYVGPGPEVTIFERELAARFRPDGDAVCVSSGTAALYLAVRVLIGRYGGRLTIPTYACAALYNACSMAGYSGALDVLDCNESFGVGGASIGAHTYGLQCNPGIIEDFTHAAGAHVDGRPCGAIGALSAISFGATKPLGVGSGGAILGPPEAIAEIRARMDYEKVGGFNFSWHDIGAAMGRERLKILDAENAWRQKTAAIYVAHTPDRIGIHGTIEATQEMLTGAVASGRFPVGTRGWSGGRVWYRYVLRLQQVEKARAHFAASGIETIVPIRTDELIHRQLCLPPDLYPNAEEIASTTLSLPIWPGMTDDQVARVADALSKLEDYQ